MRYVVLLMLLVFSVNLLYATEEKQHPVPSPQLPVATKNYIDTATKHINNLKHITVSPATINGQPNDVIRATYGGNERLCLNTGTGPGVTTTWSCVTLSAP